jgi:hypothetical protein
MAPFVNHQFSLTVTHRCVKHYFDHLPHPPMKLKAHQQFIADPGGLAPENPWSCIWVLNLVRRRNAEFLIELQGGPADRYAATHAVATGT